VVRENKRRKITRARALGLGLWNNRTCDLIRSPWSANAVPRRAGGTTSSRLASAVRVLQFLDSSDDRLDRTCEAEAPGVFHELAFYSALGLGFALVLTADDGRPRIAATVFAACVAGCFGTSALYHRPTWSPEVRAWFARLDHAGVYLLIAGTYTPFGLLVMSTD
jgi:Haemolysin-III related